MVSGFFTVFRFVFAALITRNLTVTTFGNSRMKVGASRNGFCGRITKNEDQS